MNVSIKPTAKHQAALDAAVAAADSQIAAIRVLCYLAGARPRLEALIVLCEQTRARTDAVDFHGAFQTLTCEHLR